MLYTSKGDSRLELTREGICQAKEAGGGVGLRGFIGGLGELIGFIGG